MLGSGQVLFGYGKITTWVRNCKAAFCQAAVPSSLASESAVNRKRAFAGAVMVGVCVLDFF